MMAECIDSFAALGMTMGRRFLDCARNDREGARNNRKSGRTRGRWRGEEAEGIDTPETCGRPWPHEREGPASAAQWEGRAVEDREGFQAIYAFRRRGVVEKVISSAAFFLRDPPIPASAGWRFD